MIENRNLIVVFKDAQPILSNAAFNSFFGVKSFDAYKANFGPFVDNFVPHPSYFHKEKIENGEQWFDAILELEEQNRVVSMMTPSYEPSAFSVSIDKNSDGYFIAEFTDITQTLIKRIMIENNVSIDKASGAYDKKYFLQITQSYEDAAAFNEKIIGLTEISLLSDSEIEKREIELFVERSKSIIRQDDMLVKWDRSKFLLVYLVDDALKAKQVAQKIRDMLDKESASELKYSLNSVAQTQEESLKSLIKKLSK